MKKELSLRSDLGLVVVPKILNGAATLGLNLYAARWLQPEEFGILSFCTNAMMLVDGVIGSAVDLAVVSTLTKSADTLEGPFVRIEKLGAAIKVTILLLLLGLGLAGGEAAGLLVFKRSGGTSVLVWAVLAALFLTCLRSVQAALQARRRFTAFGAADLVYTGLRICLVLGVASRWSSAEAILACYAAAGLPAALISIRPLLGRRPDSVPVNVREFLRFTAGIATSYCVGSFLARLDVLALGAYGTPHELGVYGAAATLAMIPEIAGTYAAPALLPRIQPLLVERRFKAFFVRVNVAVCTLMAAGLAAAYLLLDSLTSLVFADQYSASTDVAKVLLAGTAAAACLFPVTLQFLMLVRRYAFLSVDAVSLVIAAIAYSIVIPRYGVMGAAAVSASIKVTKTLLMQTIAWRSVCAEEASARYAPARYSPIKLSCADRSS
jgi:O-antigen/teichoic acid export membrane protein